MASLSTKIKLYCEANGKEANFEPDIGNVLVYNEGDGDYIKTLNVSCFTKQTVSQLNALASTSTTEQNNYAIRKTRKRAYGTIGDQLDLLYKDMVAGKLDTTGEWAKAIKAVKDDNPKE